MIIHEKNIDYYIDRLKSNNYFSTAGYSDGQWWCIMGINSGKPMSLGQITDSNHGKRLVEVLKKRNNNPDFLFAIPKSILTLSLFSNDQIDKFLLEKHTFVISCAYERDMVTNVLSKYAKLFSFIQQLKKMNVVIIGNKHLRGLDFLSYKCFVEISSPNLHIEKNGIENAVAKAASCSNPAVYLVSAGISTPLIVDQLCDKVKDSFIMDCASMWDAFVGISGQRRWRAQLYKNPEKLAAWKRMNLMGEKGEIVYE